jgi:hypothetical protein
MNLSSILSAVSEAWNFVWPPCALLLVLLVLLRILAPLSFKDFVAYLQRLLEQQKKVIALLRVYGLRKFVGIIEAFVILFLLYVIHQVVPAVGNAIPGQLTYTPSAIWLRLNDQESLICALASLPGSTIDTLESDISVRKKAIQAKLSVSKADYFFGSDSWQERNGAATEAFNVCKTLILYSVLIAALEAVRKRKILRPLVSLLLVLTALTAVAAYLFGEQVYGHEQEHSALLRDARVMADLDGFSCQKIPTEQRDDIRRTLWKEYRMREKDSSWRFEVVDYYVTWLRRSLFPERIPPTASGIYFSTYSLPASIDGKALETLTKETASEWHQEVPEISEEAATKMVKRLAGLDYVLPGMIADDHQQTGSLLNFTAADRKFHFFASPENVFEHFEFLAPQPTPDQLAFCPVNYTARVEEFNRSKATLIGNINPYMDLRGMLIVTEKLACLPSNGAARPLILGYKVAQVE